MNEYLRRCCRRPYKLGRFTDQCPTRENVWGKLLVCLLMTQLLASETTINGQDLSVELPEGFVIQKVADDDLIPDASAMTIDPTGAPVVSGPGYVRKLIDSDGDGVYDQAETLAEINGIAQGLCFDDQQMWMTADGAIQRSVARTDGQPFVFERVVDITTDQEHGSHAIRKGTDGWWYVLCGNATEIRKEYYSMNSSPVIKPHAGFLMRFPPDAQVGTNFKAEIFCHGFRNAYDFDFDDRGRIYVYDSDGERDISLPWYRPTRIFRMQAGDHAGWVSPGWKRPASFIDMPELVGELGRGSPTGVAVCDGVGFGAEYDQAVFVGDWTFGRIGVVKAAGPVEIFAKPKGNFGFAITEMEFSSDGELLLTTGGRGTEGAMYRIKRVGPKSDPAKLPIAQKRKDDAGEIDRLDGSSIEFARIKSKSGLIVGSDPNVTDRFLQVLKGALNSSPEKLASDVRVMQLLLGGCNGDRMFAGHQAVAPIEFSKQQLEMIVSSIGKLLERGLESYELARLIGMLDANHDGLSNALVDISAAEKDPVQRIHYLNCIAVAGGTLDPDAVETLANAILAVRREIDAEGLPVDRNWLPRMRQLAERLFQDMRIAEALVKNNSFGHPSDTWIYNSLPQFFRGVARTRIAAKVNQDLENASLSQLQCLMADAKYDSLMRQFSHRDEYTNSIVMAIHSRAEVADKEVLLRGLESLNLTVNKAALIGLQRIGVSDPTTSDFARIEKLERQLGWTNPEISVRDQAVKLLRQWTRREFGYLLRQYDISPETKRMQLTKILKWRDSLWNEFGVEKVLVASTEEALSHFETIDFDRGDMARGKVAYTKFQCANCHNGRGQNSGPSLTGIASRFSRADVLRAIVDPDENVPDRYRAMVVATEDGQFYRGSVVYESMAGMMLATSTGEIVRIDAAEIEEKRRTSTSLMPKGLLNDASDQEVADLWAYLKSL